MCCLFSTLPRENGRRADRAAARVVHLEIWSPPVISVRRLRPQNLQDGFFGVGGVPGRGGQKNVCRNLRSVNRSLPVRRRFVTELESGLPMEIARPVLRLAIVSSLETFQPRIGDLPSSLAPRSSFGRKGD